MELVPDGRPRPRQPTPQHTGDGQHHRRQARGQEPRHQEPDTRGGQGAGADGGQERREAWLGQAPRRPHRRSEPATGDHRCPRPTARGGQGRPPERRQQDGEPRPREPPACPGAGQQPAASCHGRPSAAARRDPAATPESRQEDRGSWPRERPDRQRGRRQRPGCAGRPGAPGLRPDPRQGNPGPDRGPDRPHHQRHQEHEGPRREPLARTPASDRSTQTPIPLGHSFDLSPSRGQNGMVRAMWSLRAARCRADTMGG